MESLIKEKISLQSYNTAKILATARYFAEVRNAEETLRVLDFAAKKSCPILFLGRGSNIIFKDDYQGLVARVVADEVVSGEGSSERSLILGAGIFLPEIAKKTAQEGWSGLEWAGGVPGSIGGAVRGNAGAFEEDTAGCIEKVFAIDIEKKKEIVFSNKECDFEYRESIFKKNKKYIILSAELTLRRDLSALEKYNKYFQYRLMNHPQDPSFGSTFKNPLFEKRVLNKHSELKDFESLGFIPARYLIEECGLKGHAHGRAQISEKHPNFIINKGGARGSDFVELISIVKEKIDERFGIALEEEVEIV